MSAVIPLDRETEANGNFREVLHTGTESQLVAMSIPPGGEIGEEIHDHVEQTLYFHSGEGEAVLDGRPSPIRTGDVLIVTPGTRHNVRNTGARPLKIATVYAPPNHIDGRVHRTKAEADADAEDEAFGGRPDRFGRSEKRFLAVLRIALGGLFLYAGFSHLTTPGWSAAGYLLGAKTFPAFYHWLAAPGVVPAVNFLNAWGLTLIGLSLISGLWVRLSSLFGALMMVLYYFPALQFPKIGTTGYLVDEHIVYALALLVFASAKAGRTWGLDARCASAGCDRRHPRLQAWLG